MNLDNLEESLGAEPKFRLKQAWSAVLGDLAQDWSKVSSLPLALREKLKTACPLEINAEVLASVDARTEKALLCLSDGQRIETVLMKHKDDRRTVCVSCQVGCPLDCSFCATGKMGLVRNLTVSEILEQVLFFARRLKSKKEKVTNIVFMGMGEPFLNYENVMAAIRLLNDKDGFNLGARHISISTAGITEGIEKLASEKRQVNLAISLHAPNDELRSKIMPINKKYPLAKVLSAVDEYIKKTNRRVMFEYLMIKDVNDSEEEARQLAGLLKRPLYFLNLINYNPTGNFISSSIPVVKNFKEILLKAGVAVTERFRFGRDIKAACGQLATKDKL
ncbi:MAG: 23S rRNA (adenine(2503)-C(2))-methyltransferase RlmN [Patescibacteria group bacterium]